MFHEHLPWAESWTGGVEAIEGDAWYAFASRSEAGMRRCSCDLLS